MKNETNILTKDNITNIIDAANMIKKDIDLFMDHFNDGYYQKMEQIYDKFKDIFDNVLNTKLDYSDKVYKDYNLSPDLHLKR